LGFYETFTGYGEGW
jgi:hypothetical protein